MLELDFTFNVICITDEHSLEIFLWEGILTLSLQIGMNGMRFGAGTVGSYLLLTYKFSPLDSRCVLSAHRLDLLDITHM